MSISILKLMAFDKERKDTMRQVSSSIAALNQLADKALIQQAYMRVNPDANGADELISVVDADVTEVAVKLAEVQAKLADVLAVKAGEMTVDESITKYAINLTDYSEQLR